MKVYFVNSKDKEILIGEAETDEDSTKIIKDFCNERDYKIRYMRCWGHDGRIMIDVGSHVEHFEVEL